MESESGDKSFGTSRTARNCSRSRSSPFARKPARAESGIRSVVAHGERIRKWPLWLGAVADVRRMGLKLLGPRRGDLVGGEDDPRQNRPRLSDGCRHWRG